MSTENRAFAKFVREELVPKYMNLINPILSLQPVTSNNYQTGLVDLITAELETDKDDLLKEAYDVFEQFQSTMLKYARNLIVIPGTKNDFMEITGIRAAFVDLTMGNKGVLLPDYSQYDLRISKLINPANQPTHEIDIAHFQTLERMLLAKSIGIVNTQYLPSGNLNLTSDPPTSEKQLPIIYGLPVKELKV